METLLLWQMAVCGCTTPVYPSRDRKGAMSAPMPLRNPRPFGYGGRVGCFRKRP